jgi:hypothetical protein
VSARSWNAYNGSIRLRKHFLSLFLYRVWYHLIHCFFAVLLAGKGTRSA